MPLYEHFRPGRLYGFDYRKPYYYMVTLKRFPGRPPLVYLERSAPGGLRRTPLTELLHTELWAFFHNSPGLASITPYVIMPDHLHLLIRLNTHPERHSLPQYVNLLIRQLNGCYRRFSGTPEPLLEPTFHDIIVKRPDRLPTFSNYILTNPQMALMREAARERFVPQQVANHWRLGPGRTATAVGDLELLEEPALVAVQLSRRVEPGTPEWTRMEEFYRRWRPGMVAVGTWFSKAEQRARELILENGGGLIVLTPEAHTPRWHPAGQAAQDLTSEGRLLTLFLFLEPIHREDSGEMRRRCLSLNALAKEMEEAIFTEAG